MREVGVRDGARVVLSARAAVRAEPHEHCRVRVQDGRHLWCQVVLAE